MEAMTWTVVVTPIGGLGLRIEDDAVSGVSFGADAGAMAMGSGSAAGVLADAVRELEEYFAGERTGFTVPARPARGSPFERAVWAEIAAIPYGETLSYGGWVGLQPQPVADHRAVSPGDRFRRQARRLRRRAGPQTLAVTAGGEDRDRAELCRRGDLSHGYQGKRDDRVVMIGQGATNTEAATAGAAAESKSSSSATFAKRVNIGDGRSMYIECRGKGSPTVLLISGSLRAASVNSSVLRTAAAATRSA